MRRYFLVTVVGLLLFGNLNSLRAQAPPTSTDTGNSTAPSARFDLTATIDQHIAALEQETAELARLRAAAQASPQPDQQKQIELLEKQIESRKKTIQLLQQRATPPKDSTSSEHDAAAPPTITDPQMVALVQQATDLQQEQVVAQGSAQPDLKKQVEILEKQIETQQKMIQLLVEQVKKQPELLEAKARQSAQRDLELSQAIDTVVEHQDSTERYDPSLPTQLKELFLPSGNNETPLTISGALAVGYSKIMGNSTTAPVLSNGTMSPNGPRAATPGAFYFGEFTPDFFLKLNDWIFLEAEIGIGGDGSVSAGSFAQADFIINDWLTLIAGRFVAPIGFFNERLNNPWINKLPGDAPGSGPLLWEQVLPATSLLGVQARGAFYLGDSPLKMEYSAYASNGLNVTPGTPPSIDDLANLEGMESTFASVSNEMAFGGRVAIWWPETGLEVGLSGMINGDYAAGGPEDSISLWAVDFNYHKDNWDLRAEYGLTHQQTQSFNAIPTPGLLADDIIRQGVNAQIAYRPRDADNKYLKNVELVYRFGWVNFQGIDATMLTLSNYSTPMDVPVTRNQHEIGINYYFYPRMELKVAYQFNDEPGFELHDNQFITELSWGW